MAVEGQRMVMNLTRFQLLLLNVLPSVLTNIYYIEYGICLYYSL